MKLKEEIFNENLIPADEPEMEQLDEQEEDVKIYKWLCIFLGLIWILTLLIY
jgi:hypothetical protein